LKALAPIKKVGKVNIQDFYVLDCETWGLNPQPQYLAFGVIYGYNYYRTFYNYSEFIEILKQKRFRNKKIFAHNAEFDLSAIFGNIFQNMDNEAIFNSSRFIAAKWDTINFYDSYNLLMSSVEKIGKALGYEKGKTPEKFFKSTNKGLPITEEDIFYCKRDCEIIYKALHSLFSVTESIKMTIGSMSMNFFRTNFLKETISYNTYNEKFFESYAGGRTEAFYLGKCDAKVIDINSLYPFIMKSTVFPDPSKLNKNHNTKVSQFLRVLKYYEGVIHCKVKHKETYFGYLPVKHEFKLCFPVGTFSGWFNFNEIRFAIEQGVVEILEVFEYYYAPPMKTPFAEFIEFTYKKRLQNINNFMQLVYKFLMNNLYGKFGQRKKFKRVYYESPPFDLILEYSQKNIWFEVQTLGKDREDLFLITKNTHIEKSYTAIPSFASYITSSARLYLLQNILKNSSKIRILYCDTDSIFYEGKLNPNLIKLGDELGEWKIEDKDVKEIRGLKNYTFYKDGKKVDSIKGIPRRAKKKGNKWIYETYTRTLSGLRGINNKETGENIKVEKVLKLTYDKRTILKSGNTKPLKFKQ
jgi:hypothetical protein